MYITVGEKANKETKECEEFKHSDVIKGDREVASVETMVREDLAEGVT